MARAHGAGDGGGRGDPGDLGEAFSSGRVLQVIVRTLLFWRWEDLGESEKGVR